MSIEQPPLSGASVGSKALSAPRPVRALRVAIAELRPHQWAKNALVLLPMLLAPGALTATMVLRGFVAVAAFCLCASAGYVLNDILDIEADRAHPTKRTRPFASGDLPVSLGPPLFALLVATGFGLSFKFLPLSFAVMLAIYLAGTLAYSLYLKRMLLIDVLVLAGLYTHRILAGGVASGVHVSAWLLGFSMFLFTSLAFAKRCVELRGSSGGDKIKNRGYLPVDLQAATSMGSASGYIAALVFMLYVDSAAVRVSYRVPILLWLILPILLYWLGRVWLLVGRDQMHDDPVKFAVRDPASLVCAAIITAIAALARYAPDSLFTLLG
jgi:4-hydroxybenzoate polyprenyltransferase